jgi:hypothetical protein
MVCSAAEFVTVDMRGLKAALVERARSAGISVSAFVRGAVAARLGLADARKPAALEVVHAEEGTVRLSIRLSSSQAQTFESKVAEAGMSRGNYLTHLMANAPQPPSAAERSALTAAIVASNEKVSALNRNVRHLTELLSRGSVQAAKEYRAMLDTLGADVRRHLALVGAGLQALLTHSRQPAQAVEPGKELP